MSNFTILMFPGENPVDSIKCEYCARVVVNRKGCSGYWCVELTTPILFSIFAPVYNVYYKFLNTSVDVCVVHVVVQKFDLIVQANCVIPCRLDSELFYIEIEPAKNVRIDIFFSFCWSLHFSQKIHLTAIDLFS